MPIARCRLALCVLVQALLLSIALPASAERWADADLHLSLEAPQDWQPFDPSLLDTANKQVRHVTGHRFIAGYALNNNTGSTLVFPYLLIQFKPYTELIEADRPTAGLTTRDKLILLSRLIEAFKISEPLPESIDIDAFASKFNSELIKLVSLTDDGRFDLTGTIRPQNNDSDFLIHYHTHGVIGKDGIAIVSLFESERFEALAPLIQGALRTLSFDPGFTIAELPAPVLEPADPTSPDTNANPGDEQPKPDSPDPDVTTPDQLAAPSQADNNDDNAADTSTTPTTPPADSSALIIVLAVLGVTLMGVVTVIVVITHKQAQTKRERARARRERQGQHT